MDNTVVLTMDEFMFEGDKVVIPENVDLYEKSLRQKLHKLLIQRMRAAGWQTKFDPAVKSAKEALLFTLFQTKSSVDLTYEQLERGIRFLQQTGINSPTEKAHMCLTPEQLKKLFAIGLYKLDQYYSNGWTLRRVNDWLKERYKSERAASRSILRLKDLTRSEAHYIIQRLEAVEERLHKTGKTHVNHKYVFKEDHHG